MFPHTAALTTPVMVTDVNRERVKREARLIIGALTALAIGLGLTPVASAARPGLADRISSMLDQGQSVHQAEAYVKQSTGMLGQ
jgi:hypothetical protein